MKHNFLLIAALVIVLLSCKEEYFPNTRFLDTNSRPISTDEIVIGLNPAYQITIVSEFEEEDDNPTYSLSINDGATTIINDSSFMLPSSHGYSGPQDLYNKTDILNLTQESGLFNSSDILKLTVSHSGLDFTKTIIIE